MRAVKAKALRKQVKAAYEGAGLKATITRYHHIQHKAKLIRVGTNADGTEKLVKHIPETRTLAGCPRHDYQALKKLS